MAFLLLKKNNPSSDSGSALMLKQDLTTLTESVTQLKEGLHLQINDRLDKSNAQMLKQFAQSTDIIKDVTSKLTALEKTNQQLGLWTNPYGIMIGVLAVLFTILTIIAAVIIYRQSKDYKERIQKAFDSWEFLHFLFIDFVDCFRTKHKQFSILFYEYF